MSANPRGWVTDHSTEAVLELIMAKLDSPYDIVRLSLVSKSTRDVVLKCRLGVRLGEQGGVVGPSEVETAKCKTVLAKFASKFHGANCL